MEMSSPMLAELSSGKSLGRSWGTAERCSLSVRSAEILDRRAAYDEVDQTGGKWQCRCVAFSEIDPGVRLRSVPFTPDKVKAAPRAA